MRTISKLTSLMTLIPLLAGCFATNYVRPTLNQKASGVIILDKEPRNCQYKGEIVGFVQHNTGFDPMGIQKKITLDKTIRVKNLAQKLGANRAVRIRHHTEARRIFEIYTTYRCR